MKYKLKLNNQLKELTQEESLNISGGGDIVSTLKCIAGTLTSADGAAKTLLLGVTIWGMARMAGVIAECTK